MGIRIELEGSDVSCESLDVRGQLFVGGGLITAATPAVTPAALTGVTVNDYATGATSSAFVRQGLTAPTTITGLAALDDGDELTIANLSTVQANVITLAHENAGSAAANRFILPNGLAWLIPNGAALTLRYDTTSARWRIKSYAGNQFPAGSLTVPGIVVGTMVTSGFRGASPSIKTVNAGLDVTTFSDALRVVGEFDQSGAQAAFNNAPSTTIIGGGAVLQSLVKVTSVITPAALTGVTVDDYNPSATAVRVRQDLTAATVITGMGTPTDGRIVILSNIATVLLRNITINHEDAGSAAANRFNLPSQVSLVIPVGGSMTFEYDAVSLRWRVIA